MKTVFVRAGHPAMRLTAGTSARALAAAFLIAGLAHPALAQDATSPTTGTQSDGTAADQTSTDDQTKDIVVSGFRQALESAVQTKKSRDQIVESVSAEDIGKLPDASIAESIARLPGLTSQRVSGRSNVISIRGFSPDFSTTLLNGREQTSTGDNRAVEYDQYPSEVINQVIVYKTPQASVIGQGLSGTVDLRTIRPLEYGKRVISIGARGIDADIGKLNADSKRYGYRVNGIYVDQFADGRVGVALAASYNDEPYQIQEFNAWGYGGAGPNGDQLIGGSKSYVTSTDLKRLGVTGTLEFKPIDNFTSTFDAFYSDFKDDQIKRGIELPLGFDLGGDTGFDPTTATVTGGQYTHGTFTNVEGVVRNDVFQRHAKLYSFGWNNTWKGDDGWNVTGDLSYSKTDRNELVLESYSGTGYGSGVGATDTVDFTSTDHGTIFTHQLDYSDPSLIRLTDPLGWGGSNVQAGYYNNRIVHDRIWQGRVEVAKEIEGSFLSNVKAGWNYTNHVKSLTPDEYLLQLTSGALEETVPSQYLHTPTQQAYLGLGPVISYDPLELLDAGIYKLTPNSSRDVPAKAYKIREDLMTLYAQADIKADVGSAELTGNIGLQAVNTSQHSDGFRIAGDATSLTPITQGADYWDVMPNLNLSLRFPGDFVIRGALAREVMRPRMDDMRSSYSYGLDTANMRIAGSVGDPFLRPFRANAADLSFEKYFGTKGYVAAQFFYKTLVNYIFENQELPFDYSTFPLPSGTQTTDPLGDAYIPPAGITDGRITKPINVKGGELYGVELAGTLPFGELVSALDGFGLTGGASYTKSKIQPSPNAPAQDLPGYSRWVANGTAYFEKWGFSVRGSVRYRSSFIGELSGFGANRVQRRALPETIVDGQIGYDFSSGALNGLSVYVQGQNLTDERFATTNPGEPLQVIDYQIYGRRFLAGFTFKF